MSKCILSALLFLTACSNHIDSNSDFRPLAGCDGQCGAAQTPLRAADEVSQGRLEVGIEGVVVVQFTIDKSGRTENIVVLEAENGDYFAKTALAMVDDFKYRPRIVNGEPVAADKVVQRLSFCMPEQRLMP